MANIIERTGSDVTVSEEVCERIISLEKQAKEIKKQQDSKTFKDENPDVYDMYVKISKVKPSIRITVK